jgi:membrane protease YdiL (CAAX protease family)
LFDPNNRLFVLAQRGKRLPGWFLALLMSAAFILIGGIPASIAIALLALRNPAFSPALPPDAMLRVVIGTPAAQVTMLVLGFAPVIALLWGWIALYERRPFWTVGLESTGALGKVTRGALMGLVAFSALVGLLALTGSVAVDQRTGRPGLRNTLFPVAMLLAWSVQGPAEEILLRGWLMPVIGAKHRPWLGIVLSSLTFAAFHGLNLSVTPLALLNLFLSGLLFSAIALREGGLWGACAFHATWNWVQGNGFGFEVSGTPPTGGALFDLAARGPRIWTGGSFGPEGGLAATVVIVIAIILVSILPSKKDDRS